MTSAATTAAEPITVYFCQRPLHRRRQRETVEHCPEGVRALTPAGLVQAHEAEIRSVHVSARGRARDAIKALAPLNCRPVNDPGAADAELLYTWGMIPLSRMPYVVELDNPYVLTFYNLAWFSALRGLLRRMLLHPRCRGIVCISEACRRTLQIELGEQVARKASVVYPFMADRTVRTASASEIGAADAANAGPAQPGTSASNAAEVGGRGETVDFLFVSTEFYLKGGRETLAAFERLARDHPEARLTMVTNAPADVQERFAGKPWVRFVPANLDKEELFRRHFATSNVFVMPTYWDSFGMVFLEAISFGLPIVATTLYTLPELVEPGVSGLLIEPPFPYYYPDGRVEPANWDKDRLIGKVRAETYPQVEAELLAALRRVMAKDVRAAQSQAAGLRFRDRFAKSVRDAEFLAAMRAAAGR